MKPAKARESAPDPAARRTGRFDPFESAPLWLVIPALLAAYAPALAAGFNWDDTQYVVENPTLRSLRGLFDIWFRLESLPQYYPAVHTTFWLEYQAVGLNPFLYHLNNVLLHGLNAWLVGRLMRSLGLPGAGLCVWLFAFHPVNVESVAWVTERKNVLALFFYLLSALRLVRYFGITGETGGRRHARGRAVDYLLGTGLFLMALFSKTVSCSLPAALLLAIYWRRGRITRREIVTTLPLFVLGLSLGLVTAWMEEFKVGATGPDFDLTPVERVLVAGRCLWLYVSKYMFPGLLIFFYDRWSPDASAPLHYAFPAAAIAGAAVLFALRRRIGRGPLVHLLFFGGTLSPALGFFNVYPTIFSRAADHFAYLAGIGPVIGIAWLAAAVRDRLAAVHGFPAGDARHRLAPAFALVLAGGLWIADHAADYHDQPTLWYATLRKNPNAWMPYQNLGAHYIRKGERERGIALIRKALTLSPDDPVAHMNLHHAYLETGRPELAKKHLDLARSTSPWYFKNIIRGLERTVENYPRGLGARLRLADLLLGTGRASDAIGHLRIALADHPDDIQVLNLLAHALRAEGRFAEAESCYRRALELDPGDAAAWNGLGNAAAEGVDAESSIRLYRQAVEREPGSAAVRLNAAVAVARAGDAALAETWLREALEIRPDYPEALFNLARIISKSGRAEEAAGHYRRAIAIRPDFFEAVFNLANLQAAGGDPAGAAELYERALEIEPDNFDVHMNLGIARAESGDFKNAVRLFERATRLRPESADARANLERARALGDGP